MEYIIENAPHDILKLIKHAFKFNLLDIDEDKSYTIKLIYDDKQESEDCDTLIIESGEDTPIIIDGFSISIIEDDIDEICISTTMLNELDIKWKEERVNLGFNLLSSQLLGYSIYHSAFD